MSAKKHECTQNQLDVFHILAELSDTIRLLNCSAARHINDNGSYVGGGGFHDIDTDNTIINFARMFYATVTPMIIIFGLLGNSLSLKVFTSGVMRKIAASKYLVSLATSDTIALLTYVMLEWFQRGLPTLKSTYGLNLIDIRGMCQVFLLVSYTSRLISAWLVVLFTVERYFGICRPLMQRHRFLCPGGDFSKRSWLTFIGVCISVCLYKPILSQVRVINGGDVCVPNDDYKTVTLILDITYGAFITAIPFSVIATLNVLIAKTLRRTRKRHASARLGVSPDVIVRFELTATLLLVSSTFVMLNLPYFIVWLLCIEQRLRYSDTEDALSPNLGQRIYNNLRAYLLLSKTIFFLNYCCNVLLYSVSGRYFRRELVRVLVGCSPCQKTTVAQQQQQKYRCSGGGRSYRLRGGPTDHLNQDLITTTTQTYCHNSNVQLLTIKGGATTHSIRNTP